MSENFDFLPFVKRGPSCRFKAKKLTSAIFFFLTVQGFYVTKLWQRHPESMVIFFHFTSRLMILEKNYKEQSCFFSLYIAIEFFFYRSCFCGKCNEVKKWRPFSRGRKSPKFSEWQTSEKFFSTIFENNYPSKKVFHHGRSRLFPIGRSGTRRGIGIDRYSLVVLV